jgi:hypothetical protein
MSESIMDELEGKVNHALRALKVAQERGFRDLALGYVIDLMGMSQALLAVAAHGERERCAALMQRINEQLKT